MRRLLAVVCLGLVIVLLAAARPNPSPRDPEKDKQALLEIENEWFYARDSKPMERIYAPDFIHTFQDGRIATAAEELAYYRSQKPRSAEEYEKMRPRRHFEELKVRLYGDIGIVNGRTVITDEKGEVVRKTSFTDVFQWREGRWQAINAQETTVEKQYWNSPAY